MTLNANQISQWKMKNLEEKFNKIGENKSLKKGKMDLNFHIMSILINLICKGPILSLSKQEKKWVYDLHKFRTKLT